jgi:hypothetical protein
MSKNLPIVVNTNTGIIKDDANPNRKIISGANADIMGAVPFNIMSQ